MTWGVSSYSTTPASNTSVNGTNIGEGCNASGVNDAIRQIMADIASMVTSFLTAAGNLAGLADLPTARTNLGLGTGAVSDIIISSSAPSGTPTKPTIWVVV